MAVDYVEKMNQTGKDFWNGAKKTITGFWNDYTGKSQTREANKAAQELAKYGFEQEKQMIKEQNEYNTPKSQMQRYVDAGLNPHLIYGQGTPGNQTVIAKYNSPDVKAAPRIDYLGMTLQALQGYQTLMKTMADTENVKAHSDLLGVQKTSTLQGIENMIMQNKKTAWDIKSSKGLYPSQLAISSNQTKIQEAELGKWAYENAIRNSGVNPNDAMPFRLIARLLNWIMDQPKGSFYNPGGWSGKSFDQYKNQNK